MSSGPGRALASPDSSLPRSALIAWFARLLPDTLPIPRREAWRAAIGAALGLLCTAAFGRLLAGDPPGAAWLVAPVGASAVLVFALPASPLTQPWSVLAGNTLSALVGAIVAAWIPDPALAAGIAVGAAMLLMVRLRCLHPPGGAVALLMVLTHTTHAHAAVLPVLLESLGVVAMGLVYNNFTGHAYPRAQAPREPALHPVPGHRFTAADLDVALARYNEIVDIGRADLQSLLEHAEVAAYQRKLGALRCGDVMSREPVCVPFGASLQEAWDLMQARRIKALPVVDRAQRICGIVTTADFMRAASAGAHEGLPARLKAILRPSGRTHSEQPEVVGQIMTRSVRVASLDRPVADLVPVFAEDGHHHIPIIDDEQRLAGMMTQTDLIRGLLKTQRI